MQLGEPGRAPALLDGLSDEERSRSARDYFASFRWEPPAIDPHALSATMFLALLGEVGTED